MSRLKIKHERDVDENDSSSSSSSSSSSLLLSLATTSDDSSNDENEDPLSARPCCLICSILPSLSSINSCQKHLTLIHLHHRNMRKRQKKLESESLLSSVRRIFFLIREYVFLLEHEYRFKWMFFYSSSFKILIIDQQSKLFSSFIIGARWNCFEFSSFVTNIWIGFDHVSVHWFDQFFSSISIT